MPNQELADKAHLSATVYGRVQGVFFRHFVRNTARELGLTGYVRNLPGGDAVEVQAEGERPRLTSLVERLKVGPSGAHVERVETEWADYSRQFADFSIRH
ncbi:MAG: acylphosphatase [Dehalococcoidia bacterium]|nr:acylphosphatase [Dehalococcoidia bacterium]